jgi:hypothetical protein
MAAFLEILVMPSRDVRWTAHRDRPTKPTSYGIIAHALDLDSPATREYPAIVRG